MTIQEQQNLRKSQGLCTGCGESAPRPGKVSCADCGKIRAGNTNRKREKFRSTGMCDRCGKNPHQPRSNACQSCRSSAADYKARCREVAIGKGVCTECGLNPLAENRRYCEPCLISRKIKKFGSFGLTPELLLSWGNCCHICKKSGKVYEMTVDHDHNSLLVRGLLCGSCNKGLGYFKDDQRLLSEAARYLAERQPLSAQTIYEATVKAAIRAALTSN